jgi:hypothetical protein
VNVNASVSVVGTGVYDALNTSASGSVQPVQPPPPPPSCAPAAIPLQPLKTLLGGLGSDGNLLVPSPPPEEGASGTSGDGDLYADSETEAKVDNYLSGLHASGCVLVKGSDVAVASLPAPSNSANANTNVNANTNTNANAMMVRFLFSY